MNQVALIRVSCPLCGDERARPERIVDGFALERCTRCGMVYVNPRYPLKSVQDQYVTKDADEEISLYDRLLTPTMLALFDRVLDALDALVPGRGRLLDFGCAAGHFLERAQQRGWEAHGVELAPWARQAAALRGLANLHVGTLAAQEFPDEFFDVVTATEVLEHLPAPRDELREIRRVLRPGGILFIEVPNYRRLSVLLNRDDFMLDTPMGHLNYFTPQSLRRMLTVSGFRVVRTDTHGGLKWENLLGLPAHSEVLDAYAGPPAADGASGDGAEAPAPPVQNPSTNARPAGIATRSLLRRLLDPLLRVVVYRFAHLGLCLEAYARRT